MAKKRKIGLIYQYNENWIGGTYYIENLISSLNKIPSAKKPILVLFTDSIEIFDQLRLKIAYPYITRREFRRKNNFFERLVNKVFRTLAGHNFFDNFHNDIAVVFPAAHENQFSKNQRFLYWIPDFQEHFLPEFFTKDEIIFRKAYQKSLVESAKYILFSSESVKQDFNEIYPHSSMRQFVVRFAVTHPSLSKEQDCGWKYGLPQKYFICSNQFWKHKNHSVVLKAIKLLKEKGIEILVVFTGKEYDYRNPEYFADILQLGNDLSLQKNIKFLGFIPREDQLQLMKHSLAVIQPSLFEGWSTVVEDAKALAKQIILSDIKVHNEQVKQYTNYQLFSPYDEIELGEKIENYLNTPMLSQSKVDNYIVNVVEFGNSFMHSIELIVKDKN